MDVFTKDDMCTRPSREEVGRVWSISRSQVEQAAQERIAETNQIAVCAINTRQPVDRCSIFRLCRTSKRAFRLQMRKEKKNYIIEKF